MMPNNLVCLMQPCQYEERVIQEIIEEYWEAIFPGYEQLNPRSLFSGKWLPDLFARHYRKGFGYEYLVGEIKRTNRSGNLAETTVQLLGYGRRLKEAYPNTRIKLVMLGHWSRKEAEPWCLPMEDDEENFEIVYIPLKELGLFLIEMASDALYRLKDLYRLTDLLASVDYSDFSERKRT